MKILIIDNGTSFLIKLKNLFKGHDISVSPFNLVTVTEAKKFDLIVLSGGHKYPVINHAKQFKAELDIINKARKPILGICLGFELIAFNYKCKLKRLKEKEKGVISINLIKDLITKKLDSINVYESHRWAIQDPGKNLIALGKSKDGIEIVKHRTKHIYGFQFHPEIVKDKSKGKQLFSNFLSVIMKK